MKTFIRSSCDPRNMANDPKRGRDPRLKATGSEAIRSTQISVKLVKGKR